MKFMAFKMSGFCGLRVVEEVTPVGGDCFFWHMPHSPGTFMLRTLADGPVFDTREEAQQQCDLENVGNPFAQRRVTNDQALLHHDGD